jgi:hypothetical protein
MEEGDPSTKARPTKWGSNEPIQEQVANRGPVNMPRSRRVMR